ncbi:MAG: aminotransferase class V-fold PLP-dependent enzyme [Gemmatimonadaceae bacterium]
MTFLNHASTGPLPRRTLDALTTWGALRAEPWRITLERQFGLLVRGRELCARLIGATPDEIAMMVNTTYGINFAARSLPMAPGEIVVSSEREFPANIYPWMALEKSRGVRLHLVPCRDRLADEEALLKAIEQPGVRALTVSWVSFETGKRLDLMRLGRACRERGIFFVVDAIQGVGAAPLDVKACQIDILANGAQKWLLSPWGTGFTYVRKELITQLEPTDTGWMSVPASLDFTNFLNYKLEFFDDARRFEVITLPFQDFAGMDAALELFFEVGLDRVHSLVRARADQIVAWAERRPDIRLVTPADPEARAGIVALIPSDPAGTSKRLEEAGVAHSLREGAIRLSPHFYTTEEEVDRALQLIATDARAFSTTSHASTGDEG